jgi:hypothetical protein
MNHIVDMHLFLVDLVTNLWTDKKIMIIREREVYKDKPRYKLSITPWR